MTNVRMQVTHRLPALISLRAPKLPLFNFLVTVGNAVNCLHIDLIVDAT